MATATEELLMADTRTRLEAMAYLTRTNGDQAELQALKYSVQMEVRDLATSFVRPES